jgi:hypothetical protein
MILPMKCFLQTANKVRRYVQETIVFLRGKDEKARANKEHQNNIA